MLNFDNYRVIANLDRYVTPGERMRQRTLKELQSPSDTRSGSGPAIRARSLPFIGSEPRFSSTSAYTDRY